MAFADPIAFVFAALLAALVLLYLWERQRPRVVLPSLLLWEQVRDDRIRAARWRPDLLFFLQALALSLLIVGLARPYWRAADALRSGRRHIVVLDTTASMQAREAQATRFEIARQEAAEFVDGLPAEDEVMLVAAGHSVSVLVELTRDRAAIRTALTEATTVDTGGDLSVALAFADNARQRSDLPTDILVFTDTARSQLPAARRDQVTVFQTGTSDENVAIESLQIQQGHFQGYQAAQAQIQVRNFSAQERHGLVTVQVEDQIVERNGFSLGPLETKRLLIGGFPRAGKVTARLEPADALELDNVAYGWLRELRALRLLVVSKPSALTADLRKLAPAARLDLTVVDPSAFTPEASRSADVVIFHRVAPEAPTAINALYIYPPAQGSLFASTGEATDLEVINWDAGHAALSSIEPLASRPLSQARIVTAPAASTILLSTRTHDLEFPLAFTFERGAQRHACLTFDLEAEHILRSDSTSWLLLLLNLIDWLAPQSDDVMIARTGEATSLSALAAPLRALDPRRQELAINATAPIIEPLLAGAYELSAGDKKLALLANFADPQESNIGRPAIEPPVVASPQEAQAETSRALPVPGGFGAWLWLAAAGVLVIEWIAAARRPQAEQ